MKGYAVGNVIHDGASYADGDPMEVPAEVGRALISAGVMTRKPPAGSGEEPPDAGEGPSGEGAEGEEPPAGDAADPARPKGRGGTRSG